MNRKELASVIDHTLLKPESTLNDIRRLCHEAELYGFYAVCVNPYRVKDAVEFLRGKPIVVCSVVGFPFGATKIEVKLKEAERAVEDGADEIDYVVNIGAVKDGRFGHILEEARTLRRSLKGIVIKSIIETPFLNDHEVRKVCNILEEAEIDFIKTCTGYGPRGVTLDDVLLLKSITRLKIKASGGIRTASQALSLINAGASRLGTSAGVKIVEELSE
jgi:deoxyribose-phosphate aldolase